jgi:hypothetical protein
MFNEKVRTFSRALKICSLAWIQFEKTLQKNKKKVVLKLIASKTNFSNPCSGMKDATQIEKTKCVFFSFDKYGNIVRFFVKMRFFKLTNVNKNNSVTLIFSPLMRRSSLAITWSRSGLSPGAWAVL